MEDDKSGQEWTLPAQLGQLKTGQGGVVLLGCCFPSTVNSYGHIGTVS